LVQVPPVIWFPFWQNCEKRNPVMELAEGPATWLLNAGAFVKFFIEIIRVQEGAEAEVLHSATVDELNLNRARSRTEQMLSLWRRRGATRARISNHRGEELQSWDLH
jgi:hypothetical protein